MDLTEATRIINTVPDATLRKALQQLQEANQLLRSALSGDIVLHIDPETCERTATDEAWTRTVNLVLKNSKGKVHDWCNLTFSTKASIADDSDAGTASIASQNITFTNGKASIVVSGDAEDWLADETNTLTIASLTINGNTVTGGTSVETIVAAE